MTLIRTVLTLRMGSRDMQDTTFLVNDTQIGYLAPGARRNHVLSSHRYIQLISGLRADLSDPATAAGAQREQLRLWQRCSRDVQQRGLSILSQAASHYRIIPDWLIGLDNKYLHAWLMDRYCIYLMREGELFQVEPVANQTARLPELWHGSLYQSTVEIMEGDYYLFLPPEFFEAVSAEEVQEILNGMQQLSVKINELVELARIRGFEMAETWMALQIQRIEFDSQQPASLGEKISAFTGRFKKTNQEELARQRASNSSLRQTSLGSDADLQDRVPDKKRLERDVYSEDFLDSDFEPDTLLPKSQKPNVRDSHGDRRPASHNNRSNSYRDRPRVADDARRRAARKGPMAIWSNWRKEQRWLAVLLALSILVLAVWGISSLLTGDKEDPTNGTSTTDQIADPTPTPIPPAQTTTTPPVEIEMEVIARSLNFREAPGTEAGLVTTLSEGERVVKLAEEEDGWLKVRLEDGTEAYAFGEYLSEVEDSDESES